MSPLTEKKRASNNKWDKANMKVLACKVRNDKAERFREYAEKKGHTISGELLEYVNKCIGEDPQDTPSSID